MADELLKSNLHYDEINKIRILDSDVSRETLELIDISKDYDSKVRDFEEIINGLLKVLKEMGDNVEKQKMAAIGITNQLKSISKQRESEQAKLQAEIDEKSLLLERLDAEYDSLQILEATQQETIEYLTQLR